MDYRVYDNNTNLFANLIFYVNVKHLVKVFYFYIEIFHFFVAVRYNKIFFLFIN